MENVVAYGFVKGLHDIATAVWVGGLIHMSATVLPSLRGVKDEAARKQILMILQSRLSVIVYFSIAVLVVTGILESWHSQSFRGFFSFENTYSSLLSIKHALVVMMVALAAIRQLILRKMRKAGSGGQMAKVNMAKVKAWERVAVGILLLNTVIGVAVVSLSGFLGAVS